MRPKIIFMPHANIQYSQLTPARRHWVIKNCYEKLFDLVLERNYRIAFEASGKTVDEIASQAPEVLAKLRTLVENGQAEPVASPYIHFMVSNVPRDLCLFSLKQSLDTWEKQVGKRPAVGWNPECSWNHAVPKIYKEAGLETLVMDADSFFLSFPEIRKATGLYYDVQGHSNKNSLFKIEEYIADKPEFLQYLVNPSLAPNGLKMIFRSDCMANLLLWYLMDATEGMRSEKITKEEISQMYRKWKERIGNLGTFIMPYAEDAEYIGSSAYFYVKQFNEARFFEPEESSVGRFCDTVELALEAGYEMALPSEVVRDTPRLLENPWISQIENGVAWHGGTAKAWLNTEFALLLDPVCRDVYQGICDVWERQRQDKQIRDREDADLKAALSYVASAWVSDSRWPPQPTTPGRFNVQESIADLYEANEALARSMKNLGLEKEKALYSPGLMKSQIRCAEQKLMKMSYFGE